MTKVGKKIKTMENQTRSMAKVKERKKIKRNKDKK